MTHVPVAFQCITNIYHYTPNTCMHTRTLKQQTWRKWMMSRYKSSSHNYTPLLWHRLSPSWWQPNTCLPLSAASNHRSSPSETWLCEAQPLFSPTLPCTHGQSSCQPATSPSPVSSASCCSEPCHSQGGGPVTCRPGVSDLMHSMLGHLWNKVCKENCTAHIFTSQNGTVLVQYYLNWPLSKNLFGDKQCGSLSAQHQDSISAYMWYAGDSLEVGSQLFSRAANTWGPASK